MVCDRRTFLGAVAASGLLGGCARAMTPASGPALLGPPFLAADGRIVDTGNGGISHSEGQGYGLLIAEAAGDRASFDRLWHWTDAHLSRQDVRLFSWRYDPNAATPIADRNNASDGDILIAWALARAAKRWGSADYATASTAIRSAIRQRSILRQPGSGSLLLPGLDGFVTAQTVTVNPSYYIWPALKAFEALDGGTDWSTLMADGRTLLRSAAFGPQRLPTDWLDVDKDGTVAPARGRAPLFGFDAIRVPLYLFWARETALLENCRHYWRGSLKDGRPIPAWINVVTGETAPYPLSIGGNAAATLVATGRLPAKPAGGSGDYYSSALLDLAGLATAS